MNSLLSYLAAINGRAMTNSARMGQFGLAGVRSGSDYGHVVPVDHFGAVFAAKQAADLS